MKRIIKIFALCAVVIAAASCSKSRIEQMQMAENINISCTPEVLALVGNKIPADILVTYPAEYFYKKAILEVTPVLVYEGGEQVGKTYTYQGEKVKDNYTVVPYAGGTVREIMAFDYVEGVAKSHLELRGTIIYKGRTYEVPAIKVADGCNLTQLFAETSGAYSFKKDAYQDVIRESPEGQILYDKNSAVVKKKELKSDSVKDFQALLKEIEANSRYTAAGTRVVSYASPEGGVTLNDKLSGKRAESAKKVWDKVTAGLNSDELKTLSVGQDWEGFQEAVRNSNIKDKELILRVLSMYSDPAVRESEIRNMSAVYTEINKSVFPDLRRARFIADYDYQNYTAEELAELVEKSIDSLDEEALLRAAANCKDNAKKADIYKTAVKNFKSDRANFNLAVLALNEGKTSQAAKYLKDVKDVDADVINAKGVCELQEGNLAEAAKFFNQSGSKEAKANLGTIDLMQGKYADAVAKLEGTGSDNLAVAYILNGQYDKASSAITCNCAKSNYLRAIVAARKGDKAGVAKYLEVATKNAAFKAKAEKDVEFANYR